MLRLVCLLSFLAFCQAQTFPLAQQGYWAGTVNYTSFYPSGQFLLCCNYKPFPGIDASAGGPVPGVHGGVGAPVYENTGVQMTVTDNTLTFVSVGGAINAYTGCGAGINGTVQFTSVLPYAGPNPQLFPGCFTGYISIYGFGSLDLLFHDIPASFGFSASGSNANIAVNLISNYAYSLATGGNGFSPCPGNDTHAPYIPYSCFQGPVTGGSNAFSQWIMGPFTRLGPIVSSSVAPTVPGTGTGTAGTNNAASVQSSFVVVAALLVVAGRLSKLL